MARTAIIEASAERMPKGKKVLAHLEIHPRMGGGHTVKHVYAGYQHEPKDYAFKESEGTKAMAHIARHAGLPVSGESEHERETESTDEEG